MTLIRKRICVVIASRANYARVKSVLSAIRAHRDLELVLVVSGSATLYRYGSVVDRIREDGFKVNAECLIQIEGDSPEAMAKSTGLGILELSSVFARLQPDTVLTVADRYETMSTAIAASYMNIPLAHSQGGETSGSIDESVRHAITKLSHIHFPATVRASRNLIQMGERPEYVFKTGCPSIDLLCSLEPGLPSQLTSNVYGVGAELDFEQDFGLVVQHPVTTTYLDAEKQVRETLSAIDSLGLQGIWLWPNIDAGSDRISKLLRSYRETAKDLKIRFVRNFSPEDYARLMRQASVIVGNSSSGLREGAFLGIPAVNIGDRQRTREHAENVVSVPYDRELIASAIQRQVYSGRYPRSDLFGDGRAGERIADVLADVEPQVQKYFQSLEV